MSFIPNFKTIPLFLFLFLCFSSYGQEKENPYGLKIISTLSEYQESVKQDTINKLINLEQFIPGIKLDIRYATDNNFTRHIVYTQAKAYARVMVARALLEVEKELNRKGLGLKIFDAYRPYAATLLFYKIMKSAVYVAAPWQGSRHNRGCAVDVSLINLKTGEELEMPTLFDDFTQKASPSYMDLPPTVIKNRQLLINVMSTHGFTVFPDEWWHFDYKGWEHYELLDISFEALENSQ